MRDATQTVSFNSRVSIHRVFLPFSCVCMCLRGSMDVCTHVWVHVHLYACTCGGLRLISGFFVDPSYTLLQTGPLNEAQGLTLWLASFSILLFVFHLGLARLGLQVDEHARLSFYVGSGEPNSGPHTHAPSTLTTGPSVPLPRISLKGLSREMWSSAAQGKGLR